MKKILLVLAVASMSACTTTTTLQNPYSSIRASVSLNNSPSYYSQPVGVISPMPCIAPEPRVYDSYGFSQGGVLFRRLPCY